MLILSIIVPMYKSEWCIADCITSLYHQDLSLDEYEVIAVDNGSPDGCADYIRSLQKQYANLRLISLPQNRMPSGARNAGMDAAMGKYIMFVDSDDMLYPNVLNSLVEKISLEDLDFIHFSCDELRNDTLQILPVLQTSDIMSGVCLLLYAGRKDARFDVSWGKIYNRDFLNEHNLRCNETLLYEDTEFAYRLFVESCRTKHIEDKVYIYRSNGVSETQNHIRKQALLSDINEINALYQDIQDFRFRHIDVQFVQHIIRYMRWMIQEVLRMIPMLLNKDEQGMLYRQLNKVVTIKFIPLITYKMFIKLKMKNIIR